MGWQLLWPLTLGFALSAAAQAWLPRRRVAQALGGGGPRPVALGVLLGGLSSSCSYAAVAMARTLFVGGASAPAAFALLSPPAIERARAAAQRASPGHVHRSAGGKGLVAHLLSRSSWLDLAFNFLGDWQMLYREIAGGLLLAGLAAQLPASFYATLFLKGHAPLLQATENVFVAPLVAALTFVCSIGNVAVAAVLYAKGVSFAGVLAFLLADLVIPPLLLSYRRLYGPRFAAYLSLLLYLAALLGGAAIAGLLSAAGITAHLAHPRLAHLLAGVAPNLQLGLNLVALCAAAALLWLVRSRGARDPVCGMWVEREKATALSRDGVTYWFCSSHCRARFAASLAAGDGASQEVEVAKR